MNKYHQRKDDLYAPFDHARFDTLIADRAGGFGGAISDQSPKECLDSNQPPPARELCEYCRYRELTSEAVRFDN